MTSGPDFQLAALRHQAILEELRVHGQVNAGALTGQFGVTHETIRKDLSALQQRGLLRRVHGGAVPLETVTHEPQVGQRTQQRAQKDRIAAAAQQFVPDQGAILIDSGSTTYAFAESMRPSPGVHAITNSLPIALALMAKVGTLTTLGGTVRSQTEATAGEWALRHLDSLRADVAFLGVNACSIKHGLATPDQAEAAVKAGFVQSARLRVLLADHTKFGRESVFAYAPLTDIDVIVTDDQMPARTADQLESRHGIEVVLA